VPPVVLWRDGAPEKFRRGRSISARTFDQSLNWTVADARSLITPAQKMNSGPIFSAMRVFFIWIGDLDRNLCQVRYDLENRSASPSIAFIDHSNSLSYFWGSDNCDTPLLPSISPMPDHREVMGAVADAINELPDDQVRDLISRIGEPYLPELPKSHILSNLLTHKKKLRKILKL
jgi:hypothetical protein